METINQLLLEGSKLTATRIFHNFLNDLIASHKRTNFGILVNGIMSFRFDFIY